MTVYEHLASVPASPNWNTQECEAHELQLYNATIEAITGLHREGWLPIDWASILRNPAPPKPARYATREHMATQAIAAFTPTLFEQVFGSRKRMKELEHRLLLARTDDEAEFIAACAAHAADAQRWQHSQQLARSVVSGYPAACQVALSQLGPFDLFERLGSHLRLLVTRPWCVEAWLTGSTSTDLIPPMHVELTSQGTLSRREITQARHWKVYQEYVASAALRIAREVFAILPMPVALVHVGFPFTSSSDAPPEVEPVLSVAIEKSALESLDMQTLSPTQTIHTFVHRMHSHRAEPMMPIEPLSPDDLGFADD